VSFGVNAGVKLQQLAGEKTRAPMLILPAIDDTDRFGDATPVIGTCSATFVMRQCGVKFGSRLTQILSCRGALRNASLHFPLRGYSAREDCDG
jgi:hypothetical protein